MKNCILEEGFNKFFVITSRFVVQSDVTRLLKKVLDEISWSLCRWSDIIPLKWLDQ